MELRGREVRFEGYENQPYRLRAPPMRFPESVNGEKAMHWLSSDEVLRIHDEMVQTFGGDLEVKDPECPRAFSPACVGPPSWALTRCPR